MYFITATEIKRKQFLNSIFQVLRMATLFSIELMRSKVQVSAQHFLSRLNLTQRCGWNLKHLPKRLEDRWLSCQMTNLGARWGLGALTSSVFESPDGLFKGFVIFLRCATIRVESSLQVTVFSRVASSTPCSGMGHSEHPCSGSAFFACDNTPLYWSSWILLQICI